MAKAAWLSSATASGSAMRSSPPAWATASSSSMPSTGWPGSTKPSPPHHAYTTCAGSTLSIRRVCSGSSCCCRRGCPGPPCSPEWRCGGCGGGA